MNKIRIVVADLKDDLISILKYRDFVEDLGPYNEFLSQFSDKFKRVALWFKVRDFSDTDIQSYISRFERLNVNVSISRNSLTIGNKRFIDKKEDTPNYLQDLKIELGEFIDHEYPMLPTIQVTKDIIDIEPNQVVNGISVYGIEDISDAAAVGKDTSWCITKPGNGMLQSYRDGSGATFIIIVDKNQEYPFSKVAVQFNFNNVVLLTDLVNRTGHNFTQRFSHNGRNYGTNWAGYQNYLRDMGVDFRQKRINPYTNKEELLFAHRPLSEKENEINRTIRQYNVSLQTFISWINSPDNLASRHIGLGKKLSDEVFDYIKTKNQLLPLLQQYVSTGITLPNQQEDYIFSKNQLRNTYIHSQIVAHEQGMTLNPRIVPYLNPKIENHLKLILNGIQNTASISDKQKMLDNLVIKNGYRFEKNGLFNYFFMKSESFKQILEEYPELNQKEFLDLNKFCNLSDISPSEYNVDILKHLIESKNSYQPKLREVLENARKKYYEIFDIATYGYRVFLDTSTLPQPETMNEWPEDLLDEIPSHKELISYLVEYSSVSGQNNYELIPKDNKLKKNIAICFNYLSFRILSSERILENLPEECQNVEFYKQLIKFPSNYSTNSNILFNILPLIPNEFKDENLLIDIHNIYDLNRTANVLNLDIPIEARTEKVLKDLDLQFFNINLVLFFKEAFIKLIDDTITSQEYVYSNYQLLSVLKNYFVDFLHVNFGEVPNIHEFLKKISELNNYNNRFTEDKYNIWQLAEQKYIPMKEGLSIINKIDPIFSLHIINDYITTRVIQYYNKTLNPLISPVFLPDKIYSGNEYENFFDNFIKSAELKDPKTGIPLTVAQKIYIFKVFNENQELKDVLDDYDIDRDIAGFIGFENWFEYDDSLKDQVEYSEFAKSLGNSMAEEFAERATQNMMFCYECEEEKWDGEKCLGCGYPDYNCPECGEAREGENENCGNCGYPDYPCPNCGEHGYSEGNGCDSCGQGHHCPECNHTPYVDGENCDNCGYPNPCPECGENGYDEDDGCEHCGYGKNCPNCDHTPYIDGEECENCGYPYNLPEDEIEEEEEEEVEASYKAYIKIASVLDQKGLYKLADIILSRVK